MSVEERERLLEKVDEERDDELSSEDEEDWTGSSCSSYYSDTDSSIPEWESLIEPTGQLLFIDCYPVVTQTNPEQEQKSNFTKNKLRKSTRNKFLRLIRRRESKRKSKRFTKNQENLDSTTNKVTFQDHQEGEIKEVTLKIYQNTRTKFGRRVSLPESLLGITLGTLSDGSRLMISGFTPNSEAKNDKNIKIGDWLKTINNIEVTVHNVNVVLEQLSSNNEVKLQLQRVAGVDVTKEPPVNELTNQSHFVRKLTSFNLEEEIELAQTLCDYSVGILYIRTDDLTENGPEFEGICYCYPKPLNKSKLCNSRGIFITLNQLIKEITQTNPLVTSLYCNEKLAHIAYKSFGKNLLLFMLPDNRCSIKEIKLLFCEVLRMLEFCYGSIERCFDNSCFKEELDHFFSRFFARVLSSGLWSNAEQSVDIKELPNKAEKESPPLFEDLLSGGRFLTLPVDVQMQIDDALTELEASDYREWNEDPLDCQRLFTIIGSAFYHSGYILASHFMHGDLIDVHIFCRQQGLLHLSRTEPIRSMVLWREVYPYSCNRGVTNESALFKVPQGRRYLLIVGSRKNLLVSLMEAGGCTEPAEDNIGPDAFYVEETQATLAHLQELGIPELAERYLFTNPGPQLTIPEMNQLKKKSDLLSSIKFSKSSPNLSKTSSSPTPKKPEVTSILKRRGSDQALLVNSNSVFSLPDESFEAQSEDSASQEGYSERSEISDEPVIGRRAIRERKHFVGSDDEDSDDFGHSSQISNSSYDISELRQSLLSENEDFQPMQLTSGHENVLFHYVNFDSFEGVLLYPPDCKVRNKTLELVLNNFRNCCQDIRNLFQNTLRFKNMPAQEVTKSVINKSLIAIKEYGVLFECPYLEDNSKKLQKFSYWVTGRLFHLPHPKEFYVCYQDTVPQNIVEIAYKLRLDQMG